MPHEWADGTLRGRKEQAVAQLYTSGTWIAKQGKEMDFIGAWRDFAEWTHREVGIQHARLLRDSGDPRRFLSFGPWDSLENIERWRSLPEFQERIGKMRELLEDFEGRTLEVVAEVGGG
jgi:heme-degrading monooxygenase HmoA